MGEHMEQRRIDRFLVGAVLAFALVAAAGCAAPAAPDDATTSTDDGTSAAQAPTAQAPGGAGQPAGRPAASTAEAGAPAAKPTSPSSVAVAMAPLADVRDAEDCRLTADGEGELVFDGVTNPAMSCPDAFAWKVMLDSVQAEFWRHWAADTFTWPQADWPPGDAADDADGPYPLCGPDTPAGARCCAPGSDDNPGYDDARYPAKHCPYFPDDHDDAADFEAPDLHARAPVVAQHTAFSRPDPGPVTEEGRVIRQEMSELVFRNRPFWLYTFAHDLYNQEGLAAASKAAGANLTQDAPYHGAYDAATLTRIEYPTDAVMIKTNWLNEERARELGIVNDAEDPYITMDLHSPVTDNNGTTFQEGRHFLVAFHISTKEIPDWTWATFEHVDNPGRCDYTGCNDSFGHRSPDAVAGHLAANFTAPHTRSDDLVESSVIFDAGGLYPGGETSPQLEAIFRALDMGTEDGGDGMPGAADRGWLSYRLKGSQVGFTDSMGRPTILGNSITEGGFVGSSSCMSCHARAAVDADGEPALGIFEPRLGDVGYALSNSGPPDPDWYASNSSSAHFLRLIGLQTDFVWGILFANPLATTDAP